MMKEIITKIKKQAIKEACSANSIELKRLFPTKESFIEALNNSSPILMIILPRLLKLPEDLEIRGVDYISTTKSSKKDKTNTIEQREIVFHITTSDLLQQMTLKKDLNQFYEKICEVRMCFTFRLEKGYIGKDWYDYNY